MTTEPTDTAPATDLEQATPATPPAPAYGVIKARTPFRWGSRRLAAGEVVIDLRARGGQEDFDTFRNLLRWSSFTVEQIEAPAAPAAAPAVDTTALEAERAAAAAKLAIALDAIAALQAEVDQLRATAAAPAPAPVVDAIAAIAASAPAALIDLPGIGEKKAADLIAAAQAMVAARTAAPSA